MPVDSHTPGEHWEFNDEVCQVFADMLRRSIPQYDLMRSAVYEVGSCFVQPNTCVVDLGCSKGDALAPFIEKYGSECSYLGLELSKPMLDACQQRYREEIAQGYVSVKEHDLRNKYPNIQSSLTLSVLTLQFTRGAFILVEKVLGDTADINELMVDNFHQMKAKNGYSDDAIERKRLSLEGVLVPVTARWNEELLRSAGFTQVDCFWRWMNFAAWVAVAPS